MDSIRFDSLTRHLTCPSSRRQATRTLAASGLALGLARLGLGLGSETAVDAKKGKRKGKKKKLGARCKKNDECKGALECKKSNSQNSCYAKTEERCCKPIGAKCDDGCECCGVDVICNGGFCQGA